MPPLSRPIWAAAKKIGMFWWVTTQPALRRVLHQVQVQVGQRTGDVLVTVFVRAALAAALQRQLWDSLQDLVTRGLVDARYLTDPWGRPYRYVPQGNGYLLSGVDEGGRDRPGVIIERTLSAERP